MKRTAVTIYIALVCMLAAPVCGAATCKQKDDLRDKVLQIISRPFPREAEASREQLMALGSPAIPWIVEAIRSDAKLTPIKKAFLVDVISRISGRDASSTMIRLLEDDDPFVRGLSASRLGELRSGTAIPHLIRLLHDKEVYQTVVQTDPAAEQDILVRDVAIEALRATTGMALAERDSKDEQVKAWTHWWSNRGRASAAPQGAPRTESPCQRWDRLRAHLLPFQSVALNRDLAVYVPRGFVLSADLVADCDLRGEMSEYFSRAISLEGENSESDRRFAAKHSKEIVAALRRIWPSLGDSKALVVDGDFDNMKYVLLADPALRESDIAPLISDILDAETIDNALGRIIFHRPLPEVRPALLRIVEEVDNPSSRILTLTLLHKLGEASALPQLKRLSRDPSLSAVERRYASAIAARAARGEEINFSDVERLEYEEADPTADSTKIAISPPEPR